MNKNTISIEIFFYATFLFVCIFVLFQSPLAPFAKSSCGIDSGIYIYSARQILDGQIMYKDIVDHKGPFLYLINVLALFIFNGKFIGIWIFEIISLFAASIIMYKTARFFAGKISSFFAVVTAALFLVPLLNGGNYTEEWALPFISIASYIFIAYLKNNKPFSVFRLLVLSLTFVLTFMIRANLAAVWAGFGIILLIKWIIEKKYKELIRSLSFILLFVFLFTLPFFLYFYFKGALSDAIYLVFKFNMFEYEPQPVLFTLKRCFKILAGLYNLSIIPFFIVLYMFFRNKSTIHLCVISAFIFTSFACSLGGRFPHYFLIFMPLLVIPYSYIFDVIKESLPKAKYALLFLLFLFYNYDPAIIQAQNIADNYSEKGYGIDEIVPPPTMEKLKKIIIQNSKSTDKILVRGYQSSVYLYSGRTCATKFPYTLNKSSLAKEQYVGEVEKALPELILQGGIMNTVDSFNLDNLLNEKYRLLTNIEGVEVWKLKE